MGETIRFFAEGTPKPLARPRATSWRARDGTLRARVYDGGSSRDWGERVGAAALAVRPREPLHVPVSVTLTFYLPRPARLKRPSVPPQRCRHSGRPDLDNLIKRVLDSVPSLIADDKLVCEISASKWYAAVDAPCGVEVEIATAEP